MDRLIENLRKLGAGRLLALALGVAATVAVVGFLALSTTRPDYVPLYSGLDARAAGEVAARLDAMAVPYQASGTALLVPAAARDRARMSLAAEGLPRQGQAGYELLDGLDGFGVTAEMFDATYWRAKEGELARTIAALDTVQGARVHIARPARTAFSRERVAPSASVVVTMAGGAALARRQAFAVRHIVALAVKGLDPGRVTVIDSAAGLVLGPDNGEEAAGGDDARLAREARLRGELEALLGAHVGAGRVRVSVAVETDNETESVTERRIDPEGRVAVRSDLTETAERQADTGDRPVGVAGNLPEAEEAVAGGGSSRRTETAESVQYEVSEVRRERHKPAGTIRRISVAVLVDGKTVATPDGGTVWQPRSAQELETIAKLVRSAIAFDAARGDAVTVENLPFAVSAADPATPPDSGLVAALAGNLVDLAEILGLVLVIALLMWFVVRPLTNGRAWGPVAAPVPESAADGEPLLGYVGAAAERADAAVPGAAVPQLEAAAVPAPAPEHPHLARLHAVVDEKPDEAFALIRRWLHETEEEAA